MLHSPWLISAIGTAAQAALVVVLFFLLRWASLRGVQALIAGLLLQRAAEAREGDPDVDDPEREALVARAEALARSLLAQADDRAGAALGVAAEALWCAPDIVAAPNTLFDVRPNEVQHAVIRSLWPVETHFVKDKPSDTRRGALRGNARLGLKIGGDRFG